MSLHVYRYARWTDLPPPTYVYWGSASKVLEPIPQYDISRVSREFGLEAWDYKQKCWVDGRGLAGRNVKSCRLEVCLLVGEY